MTEENVVVAIGLTVILGLIGWAIYMPKMESDAFNKLCNGHTTYWDAVVTELRVDGVCTKEANQ